MSRKIRAKHLLALAGLAAIVGLLPVRAYRSLGAGDGYAVLTAALTVKDADTQVSAPGTGYGKGNIGYTSVTPDNGGTITPAGAPPGTINGAAGADLLDACETAQELFDLASNTGTAAAGGDLNGVTLNPGVYIYNGDTQISAAGVLTLDGAGDYLIAVDGSLAIGDGANIALANGANAANVTWVVDNNTVIGAANAFNGRIISGVGTTVGPGAVINGAVQSCVSILLDGANTVNDSGVPPVESVSPAAGAQSGTGTLADPYLVCEGEALTYQVSAYDPDATGGATAIVSSGDVATPGYTEAAGAPTAPATVATNVSFTAPAGAAAYHFTYTATDPSSAVAIEDVYVQVVALPVLGAPFNVTGQVPVGPGLGTAGSPYLVCAGDILSFQLTATDADAGDSIALGVTGQPGSGFTLNPAAGVAQSSPATTTVTLNSTGLGGNNYHLVFTPTDSYGCVGAVRDVYVNVLHIPAFVAPTPSVVNVCVGDTLRYDVRVTDAIPAERPRVSVENVPVGAIHSPNLNGFDEDGVNSGDLLLRANPAATRFEWTPIASDAGAYPVIYTAIDSHGCSVSHTVTINVSNPPVIAAPANITNALGGDGSEANPIRVVVGSNLTFDVSASDVDLGDQVSLSVNDAAGSGVTPTSSAAPANPVTLTQSIQPTDVQAGKLYLLTYTASSTGVADCTATRTVYVQVIGRPVITVDLAGPYNLCVGDSVTIDLKGSDPNPAGIITSLAKTTDQLTGTTLVDVVAAPNNPVERKLTYTAVAADAGTNKQVIFTATNAQGQTTTLTLVFNISRRPTLSIGSAMLGGSPAPGAGTEADPYVVPAAQALTYTVTGADADGNQVTLNTTSALPNLVHNPAGLPVVASPAVLNETFTPSTGQAGQTHTVVYTAADDSGAACQATRTLYLRVVAPPVITLSPAGPYTLALGDSVNIAVKVNDPNPGGQVTSVAKVGDQLTGTVFSAVVAVPSNPAQYKLDYTAVGADVGTNKLVTILATNSFGLTSTAVLSFTITDQPEVTITSPVANSCTGNSVPLAGTITGANLVASYTLDGGAAQALTVDGSGAFSTSVNVPTEGSHTIVVSGTDPLSPAPNSDTASVTFTVDAAVPTAVITPLANSVRSGTVAITGSVADTQALAKWDLWLDNVVAGSLLRSQPVSGTNQAVSFSLNTLQLPVPDGAHTLILRATDTCGKVSTDATLAIIVDNTKPVVTITSPEAGDCVDSITLAGTIEDANFGSATYTLDGGAPVALPVTGGAFSAAVAAGQGDHTIVVTAVDSAATTANTASATVAFAVDTAPPTAALTPLANSVRSGTVPIAGTVADSLALAKWELWLDNVAAGSLLRSQPVSGTSQPVSFSLNTLQLPVPDGAHTLILRATDTCGKVSTDATLAIIVDNTRPMVTIDTPVAGTCVAAVNLTGTIVDANLGAVTYTLDGGSAVALPVTGGEFDVTVPAAQGNHTIVVTATDTAATTANTRSASVSFTVDAEPPTAAFTALANPVRSKSIPVAGTVTDVVKLARWELYLDAVEAGRLFASANVGGTSQSVAATLDTLQFPVTDGAHTLILRSIDACGQVSADATQAIIVDNTKPVVTITSPEPGLCIGAVTLEGTVADANIASATYTLDGGSAQPLPLTGGAFSEELTGIAEGEHTLTVTAVDQAAGTPNTSSASVTFTVDTAPPVAVLNALSPNVVAGTVPVTGKVTDGLKLARWELYLDNVAEGRLIQAQNTAGTAATGGGVEAMVSASLNTLQFPVPDGPHTLILRAVDACGQVSDLAQTTIIVDNTGITAKVTGPLPAANGCLELGQVTVTRNGQGTSVTANVTATVTSANIDPAQVQLTVNGTDRFADAVATTAGNVTTYTLTNEPLQQGGNTVTISAKDKVAPARSASDTLTFKIDVDIPVAAITKVVDTSGDHGANEVVTGEITLKGTATDNLGLQQLELLVDGQPVNQTTPATGTSVTLESRNPAFKVNTRQLSEGLHTVSVVATDACGNVGTSPAFRFRVGNTSPSVVIISPADGARYTNATAAAIKLVARITGQVGLRAFQIRATNATTGNSSDTGPVQFQGVDLGDNSGPTSADINEANYGAAVRLNPAVLGDGRVTITLDVFGFATPNTQVIGTATVTININSTIPTVAFATPSGTETSPTAARGNGVLPVNFTVNDANGDRLDLSSLAVTVYQITSKKRNGTVETKSKVVQQFGPRSLSPALPSLTDVAPGQTVALAIRLSPNKYKKGGKYKLVVTNVRDTDGQSNDGNAATSQAWFTVVYH